MGSFRYTAWILAIAIAAHAQDDRRAARAEFRDGERAFAAGEIEGALAHFRRAFELAPHDAVRFNLAICYERLGRVRDAVREYEAAAASEDLDRPTRARAERLADQVRVRLGTLVMEGPEGMAATVDGEAACALPCRWPADPGSHEVRVARAEGDLIERVEVESGATATVRFVVPEQAHHEEPIAIEPVVAPPVARPEAPREVPTYAPTWLTWTGAIVAGLGGAAIGGFGAGALVIHDGCNPACDPSTAQTGELMRDLANASIAVAGAGVLAIAIDLIFLAPGSGRARVAAVGPAGLQVRF